MQMNEEFDVQVLMYEGEPVILGMTPAGHVFLAEQGEWLNLEDFLSCIPPGLRVGLKNPETNLFAQLPPRSLH
jgi:hypothetical protein